MKASDVMKTQVKWLKDRCKAIQKEINEHHHSGWYEDHYGDRLRVQLEECVSIKISTEKYMKKLRHEGTEMYKLLSKEQLAEIWSFKAGDWYEKVDPDNSWLECGRCGVLPRTWRFDNGLYATCICYDRYEEKPVRVESINSVYTRTGLTEEYEPDNLRLTWNLFAKDGVERNKLGEGKW